MAATAQGERIMLKKLNIVFLLALLVMILTVPGLQAADETAPKTSGAPAVSPEAEKGLALFLGFMPVTGREDYGFTPEDRLEEARLRPEFNMLTITPAALNAYQKGDPVSSLLSETTMSYYPVVIDEEIKALLLLDGAGEQRRAVGLGYPRLARAWVSLLGKWPEADGYHPKLAAVMQTGEFYFTVPELDHPNLTLLTLPVEGLVEGEAGPDYSVTQDPVEVVTGLKSRLAKQTDGGN